MVGRTLSVPIPVFVIILTGIQDSVSVENALYADDRVLEVAALGVPDARLGELVTAIVSIKPAYHGKVTEASLKSIAQERYILFSCHMLILNQRLSACQDTLFRSWLSFRTSHLV